MEKYIQIIGTNNRTYLINKNHISGVSQLNENSNDTVIILSNGGTIKTGLSLIDVTNLLTKKNMISQ